MKKGMKKMGINNRQETARFLAMATGILGGGLPLPEPRNKCKVCDQPSFGRFCSDRCTAAYMSDAEDRRIIREMVKKEREENGNNFKTE